jgi:hypothetical protein
MMFNQVFDLETLGLGRKGLGEVGPTAVIAQGAPDLQAAAASVSSSPSPVPATLLPPRTNQNTFVLTSPLPADNPVAHEVELWNEMWKSQQGFLAPLRPGEPATLSSVDEAGTFVPAASPAASVANAAVTSLPFTVDAVDGPVDPAIATVPAADVANVRFSAEAVQNWGTEQKQDSTAALQPGRPAALSTVDQAGSFVPVFGPATSLPTASAPGASAAGGNITNVYQNITNINNINNITNVTNVYNNVTSSAGAPAGSRLSPRVAQTLSTAGSANDSLLADAPGIASPNTIYQKVQFDSRPEDTFVLVDNPNSGSNVDATGLAP